MKANPTLGGGQDVAASARRRIPIANIKINRDIQQRVDGTDNKVVTEYAERMADGAVFPPPVVFGNDSDGYVLADGFHRLEVHRRLDAEEVECEVYSGGYKDALLFACGANADHGLPRSNADRGGPCSGCWPMRSGSTGTTGRSRGDAGYRTH
jgi:ParB-like nuclease domain